MELIMIELLLWIGLIAFFWTLRSRMHQIESEIESMGLFAANADQLTASPQYDSPERLFDAIGTYMDTPIYRFAVFGGRQYQFDYVCPAGLRKELRPDHRCITPGLLYRPCDR